MAKACGAGSQDRNIAQRQPTLSLCRSQEKGVAIARIHVGRLRVVDYPRASAYPCDYASKHECEPDSCSCVVHVDLPSLASVHGGERRQRIHLATGQCRSVVMFVFCFSLVTPMVTLMKFFGSRERRRRTRCSAPSPHLGGSRRSYFGSADTSYETRA